MRWFKYISSFAFFVLLLLLLVSIVWVDKYGAPKRALEVDVLAQGKDTESDVTLKPAERKELLRELLPYAALSELVYDKPTKSHTAQKVEGEWKQYDFSPDRIGLQYKIYLHEKKRQIVLVFAGTQNEEDWYTNVRVFTRASLKRLAWLGGGEQRRFLGWLEWILNKSDDFVDHYMKHLGDQYGSEEPLDALQMMLKNLPTNVKNYKVILAGHSLGGGLAQAAYYKSRCGRRDPYKIDAVYVFNSSPVTQASDYRDCVQSEKFGSPPITSMENHGEVLAIGREAKSVINILIGFEIPEIKEVACKLEPGNTNQLGKASHGIKEMVQNMDSRKDDENLICWRN